MANPLATVGEFELFLGFAWDTADRERADLILRMASSEVRTYVGSDITTGGVTDLVVRPEPIRRRLIRLDHHPVDREGFAVEIDAAAFSGFDLDNRTGNVWRIDGARWPLPWLEAITVTYTYGIDPEDIPEPFKTVTMQRAGQLWVNPEGMMQRGRQGTASAFGSSTDEVTGLTKKMMATLDGAMRELRT